MSDTDVDITDLGAFKVEPAVVQVKQQLDPDHGPGRQQVRDAMRRAAESIASDERPSTE